MIRGEGEGNVRRILSAAVGGAVALLAMVAIEATAQTFPAQPIKLVVPASPGGSTDVVARSLAQVIQRQTGATVIVDNRGGAGGAIGVAAVVNAPADGYTLLVTAPDGVTVLPHLRKDIPYQALHDLTPIALVAETYWLFAVPADMPAKTMKALVEAVAAKPGSIRYSSPGIGTSAHLITERLCLEAHIEMLHVPYKGAGPATAAAVSGEVDLIATSPVSLASFLESGKLRGLAVTSAQRLSTLPDIPTMIEAGFPEFAASAWFGVFAPAGLPAGRADRLYQIVSAAIADPGFQKQLVIMGLSTRQLSRGEFADFVAADSVRWKEVIEKSKISIND
jgi:tripartite-type tricarboxylate transporter receptor subunit TctC